ncbi:hypothetical protein [Flavobacterium sp. UBA7680]|uniref:hypothetical protein n=1 Tax=Flavobacterium sp. UBA7680 TaxID=1946559 RepID=UPI0025C35E75|nr:hypothetical protein [Flavobacterium sp. UBA7680]
MWVTRKDNWHKDMTPFEKFLSERIIQRCDYEESISKKHRTINGYTQLKELVKLCELSFKRIRTNRNLSSVLLEARSTFIKQNIRQDLIIETYFTDLKDFIINYDVKKINSDTAAKDLTEIRALSHQLKIFEVQLDKYYYSSLIKELTKINYHDLSHPHITLKRLSLLIDIYISLMLYNGYSISSINEVLRRWIEKKYRITVNRIITFFNFHPENYTFLIRIGKEIKETTDFINLIKESKSIEILKVSEITENLPTYKKMRKSDMVLRYDASTIDPNAHIRSQYDILLKKLVIGRDRKTLVPFTDYFKDNFWKRENNKRFTRATINGDPISVPSRKNTLRDSLIRNTEIVFDNESEIKYPENPILQKSIYYYNLALGSKSIENSLSLLWTSLETVLPYRIFNSDIESIKHILGKSLSIGAIARDFNSLIERIKNLNKQNGNCFISLDINEFEDFSTPKGQLQWYEWLLDNSDIENRFRSLSECSELLAYEYLDFAKPISEGKLKWISNRINSSKQSIEHQLQRIYLHRNQIVHSGDMINEYSNLWLHLEWYVGKILYYSLLKTELSNQNCTIENIFRELEAEYDYITSYMNKNESKKCKDSDRIMKSLLEQNWQAS